MNETVPDEIGCDLNESELPPAHKINEQNEAHYRRKSVSSVNYNDGAKTPKESPLNNILSNDLNEHLEKEKHEVKSCCTFFTIKNGVHLIGGLVYLTLLQGVIVFLLCEAISINIAIGCLAYLLPQCLAFFLYVMFYLSRDSTKLRKTLRWAYLWMQISLLIEALWIPLSILRMDE